MRLRQTQKIVAAVVLTPALALAVVGSSQAHSGVGTLRQGIASDRAHEHTLTVKAGSSAHVIALLARQLSVLDGRVNAVQSQLHADHARLTRLRNDAFDQRARSATLRRRYLRDRSTLERWLVSEYEDGRPDLIDVVLSANGFSQLLERVDFLHRLSEQEGVITARTHSERNATQRALADLGRLKSAQQHAATLAETERAGLQGIQSQLASRQAALTRARELQVQELAQTRAHRYGLEHKLSAELAALAAPPPPPPPPPTPVVVVTSTSSSSSAVTSTSTSTSTLSSSAAASPSPSFTTTSSSSSAAVDDTPSGGFAIPYAIVQCESGGQNLPPNGGGASGYYQILPSTWTGEGGSGPAAYLAPKSEQDQIAAKLWDNGAGASNWTCAAMVGIG